MFKTSVSKATDLDKALKKVGASTEVGSKARKDLESLNTAIATITGQQKRLADAGVLAAKGIEQIGGPARLTVTQLGQLNRTVQDSLDAFRALGQQAPKELQKVADAIAKQQKAQVSPIGGAAGALSGAASSLPGGGLLSAVTAGGPAAAAAAAATAMVASTKAAIDYADSLTKLSDKSGIGTEALQRLESIALASGNTLDQVGTGVSQFQNRIASGDKTAAASLNEIGISVQQIRALAPDQQFIAIAHGIQSIKDPADQTRIAMDLFGKSGAELLPSLKSNVDDLAKSTVVMSADSVAALDRAGDAWAKFMRDVKVSAGEVVGSIAQEFERREKDLRDIQHEQDLRSGRRTADIALAPGPKLVRAAPFGIKATTAQAEFDKQFGTAEDQLRKAVQASDAILEAHRTKLRELGIELSGGKALEGLRDLTAVWRAQPAAIRENPLAIARVVAAYEPLAAQLSPDQLPADLERLRVAFGKAAEAARKIEEVEAIRNLKLDVEQVAERFRIAAERAQEFNDKLNAIEDGSFRPRVDPAFLTGPIPSLELIKPDVPETIKKTKDGLSELSRALSELAQVSDGTFGGMVKGLAQIVTASNLAKRGIDQIKSAKDKVTGKVDQFAVLSGVAGIVGAEISIVQGITKAIDNALEQLERSHIFKDIGRDLGVSVSDGVVDGIRAKQKQLQAAFKLANPDFSPKTPRKVPTFRGEATALNLPNIIQDAGGVEAFGFNKAIKQAHDLFSLLETGKLTVAQVGKTFDEVFAQLVPLAISQVSGLVSAQFVDLEQTALRFQTKSPALEAFRKSQTDQVTGGLADFFKKGKIGGQSSASAFGGAFAAQFVELQRQGVSLLDIVHQMAPSIEAFRLQLKKLGLDGGAAFDRILGFADLVKDKVAGPALDSISALQKVLSGLANTGGLDQNIFAGFTDQIGATFRDLTAKGLDPDKIAQLLAPTLQTLFELQERGLVITDETTKALLDAAVQQGRVGDQFKNASERTVDGLTTANRNLDRTNTILQAIANKLGATVPKPPNPNPQPREPKEPPPTVPALQAFPAGGRVLPFLHQRTVRNHGLIAAEAGEIVLNAAQQNALAGALAGGTGGGVTLEMHFHGPVFAERAYMQNVIREALRSNELRQEINTAVRRAG